MVGIEHVITENEIEQFIFMRYLCTVNLFDGEMFYKVTLYMVFMI